MLGNIETIRNIHDSPEKEVSQSEYNSLLIHEFYSRFCLTEAIRLDWGDQSCLTEMKS